MLIAAEHPGHRSALSSLEMSTVRTSNSLMYVLPQHDARWLVTFWVPLRNHSLVFFLAGGQCVCRQFHANSNQLLIKGFAKSIVWFVCCRAAENAAHVPYAQAPRT